MNHHTRHLTNLDREDLPRYQGAIDELGAELSIRPGAFDCEHNPLEENRYSLWGPLLLPNLQAFWDLVEGR